MGKSYKKDPYQERYGEGFGKPWHIKGDRKSSAKPGAAFKEVAKSSRKAKERDAMRHLDENEIIPEFPKTDTWDFN